jgi:diaminopimelate epimerase
MTLNQISRFNNTLTHMTIAFNKYQGTGNDFIIIDNRNGLFNPGNNELVKFLCDRRFGIGADGLILISSTSGYDFRMIYYNSDGNESSMCGNGGRCAAAFAIRNSIAGRTQKFMTFDGLHEAIEEAGIIRLKMNDVTGHKLIDNHYFINTGSPHYVVFAENVRNMDVRSRGKELRWSEKFAPAGTNVNFAEITGNGIFVRTFERGVEDETLSCGTGVTASAIASVLTGNFKPGNINIETPGGKLSVEFRKDGDRISDIWLSGPATFVFEGSIDV